ncbi:13982_t:CDS:2, partial [Rhizophagus irregularis]
KFQANFATMTSVRPVPARRYSGGTLAELRSKENTTREETSPGGGAQRPSPNTMTNIKTTDDVFSFNILPLYGKERNVNGERTFGLKFYKDDQCTFLQPLIKERLIPNPVYAETPSNELLLLNSMTKFV